jgi:hypothetical protein
VLTTHLLSEGTRLQLAVPHLRRLSWATVVWLGSKLSDAQEIGIELDETADFWALNFPSNVLLTEPCSASPSAEIEAFITPPAPTDTPQIIRDLAHAAVQEALGEALQQLSQRMTAFTTDLEAILKRQVEDQVCRALKSAMNG